MTVLCGLKENKEEFIYVDQCLLIPLAPRVPGESYFTYSTVLFKDASGRSSRFHVHWEVFRTCAKQKLVFSGDRAAAAAQRLPACQPRQ